MRIKVFGREDCPKCQTTKNKLKFLLDKWEVNGSAELLFYDMDTVEGLSESALSDVREIPTTIMEKEGKEIFRWEGKVPLSQELERYLKDMEN